MTNSKEYTYVSAFAGIGGISMGFESLPFNCVRAWEYDPSQKQQITQQAHKLLHPHIQVDGDICEVDTNSLPDFDVLAMTPPCQSYSRNGKRQGLEDTRGTLTFNALKLAQDKKPKIIFMENVSGLIDHDGNNTFKTILHSFNDVGYIVDFKLINSREFNVPQSRDRVYIVGVREDLIHQEEWLHQDGKTKIPRLRRTLVAEELKVFNFEWPEGVGLHRNLMSILDEAIDPKHIMSQEKTDELTYPLDVYVDGLPIRQATKQGYAIAEVGDSINTQFPKSKTRRGRVGKQIANTIEASTVNQGVLLKDENDKFIIKKFSPSEYLRLQAIPEDKITTLSENFADTKLIKFAGNGLSIPVVEAIGKKIYELLNIIENGGITDERKTI